MDGGFLLITSWPSFDYSVAYFRKTVVFQKNDPPEAAPPTDGELITRGLLSITPRPILDYPAAYYRLPRDLLSITPRPIIDYPTAYFDYAVPYFDYAVTYYRFPQKGNAASVA